jgi:hypothetical protein
MKVQDLCDYDAARNTITIPELPENSWIVPRPSEYRKTVKMGEKEYAVAATIHGGQDRVGHARQTFFSLSIWELTSVCLYLDPATAEKISFSGSSEDDLDHAVVSAVAQHLADKSKE